MATDFTKNKQKATDAENADFRTKQREEAKGAPLQEIHFMPSTLETVDFAVYEWLTGFNLHTNTNEGFKPVPVIWAIPERAFQMKNNKDMHDKSETLKLPLISIERESIDKNPSNRGDAWGNIPPVNDYQRGSITVARRIDQKTSAKFARADAWRKNTDSGPNQRNVPKTNKKVVYQTVTMPMPVYIDIVYSINLRTEYQEQMNDLVVPFITNPGGINYQKVSKDGHNYDAFIQQSFLQENNIASMGEEERTYKTKINLKVLGYLMGADKNQESPKVVIRENAVTISFPRERVMTGDIPQEIDKRGFYRE